MSSIFDRILKSTFKSLLEKGIREIFRQKKDTTASKPEDNASSNKSHPWRLCPIGEHWVRTHDLTIPESHRGPEYKVPRQGGCHKNPGKSDYYSAAELKEIAEEHFGELAKDINAMPIPDALEFPNGNKYDDLIAGWTKFWNEVLKPRTPLTADFVKALIATESGFKITDDVRSRAGAARGLIQITESTRKILKNPKGEVRDHQIEMTEAESREPAVNIAAGVRWLHYKKQLAERRLKKEITWEDAAAEYKGISQQLGHDKTADEIMIKLRGYNKRLKDQRK